MLNVIYFSTEFFSGHWSFFDPLRFLRKCCYWWIYHHFFNLLRLIQSRWLKCILKILKRWFFLLFSWIISWTVGYHWSWISWYGRRFNCGSCEANFLFFMICLRCFRRNKFLIGFLLVLILCICIFPAFLFWRRTCHSRFISAQPLLTTVFSN